MSKLDYVIALRKANDTLVQQARDVDNDLALSLEAFRLTNENEILRAKLRERGVKPEA